jgi:hypothetical protein
MITTYTDGFSAIGDFPSNIRVLAPLNDYRYENFFKLYLTENNQYFYNLHSFAVYFLEELDPLTYYEIRVNKNLSWTSISYNEYRTMDLWWLIVLVNKIYNPLKFPEPGSRLKILYPEYVRSVITKINNEL